MTKKSFSSSLDSAHEKMKIQVRLRQFSRSASQIKFMMKNLLKCVHFLMFARVHHLFNNFSPCELRFLTTSSYHRCFFIFAAERSNLDIFILKLSLPLKTPTKSSSLFLAKRKTFYVFLSGNFRLLISLSNVFAFPSTSGTR